MISNNFLVFDRKMRFLFIDMYILGMRATQTRWGYPRKRLHKQPQLQTGPGVTDRFLCLMESWGRDWPSPILSVEKTKQTTEWSKISKTDYICNIHLHFSVSFACAWSWTFVYCLLCSLCYDIAWGLLPWWCLCADLPFKFDLSLPSIFSWFSHYHLFVALV